MKTSVNSSQFLVASDWWLLQGVLRRSLGHFGAIDWQTGGPLTAWDFEVEFWLHNTHHDSKILGISTNPTMQNLCHQSLPWSLLPYLQASPFDPFLWFFPQSEFTQRKALSYIIIPSSVGSPVAKQANEPLPAEGEPWWYVVHRAPFQENQEHRMTSKQACWWILFYSLSRHIQTTTLLWFGISKVLPSSSIQVQAAKKWCERCYEPGWKVHGCEIATSLALASMAKAVGEKRKRLHTSGRQTTCVWHRYLRIVSRQACASGWGGGKVVQYRSFCASPSATSQNSRKVSCINLCFCRISLFKVCVFSGFNPVTNRYFQTRYLHIFTHHRSACAAEVQVQARRAWKYRAFSRGSYFTVFCPCAMRKYTNIIRLTIPYLP